MLNKLIQMSKQEGMFDTAFLLATKHNLYNELFNSLRKNHNISFSKLKYLVSLKNCDNINYPYLDICYNITELKCFDIQIYNLDISHNHNLKYLYCYSNNIENIHFSNNIHLTHIYCQENSLEMLNLVNCKSLVFLSCFENDNLKQIILNKSVEGKIIINKDTHTEIEYVE